MNIKGTRLGIVRINDNVQRDTCNKFETQAKLKDAGRLSKMRYEWIWCHQPLGKCQCRKNMETWLGWSHLIKRVTQQSTIQWIYLQWIYRAMMWGERHSIQFSQIWITMIEYKWSTIKIYQTLIPGLFECRLIHPDQRQLELRTAVQPKV